MESQTNQIDLSSIDWNNLSVEDFHKLEAKIDNRDSAIKSKKNRKVRVNNSKVAIELGGKSYSISAVLFNRLSELKSERSKQKLIEEILETHSPIEFI